MASMAGVLTPACSTGRGDQFGANRSEIGALEPKIWGFKVHQPLGKTGAEIIMYSYMRCIACFKVLTFSYTISFEGILEGTGGDIAPILISNMYVNGGNVNRIGISPGL